MTGYKFVTKKKWIREGIHSIVYVLIITFISIYSYIAFDAGDFTNPIISIILIALIIIAILRAIYYFKLDKKDYLILKNNSLSTYRGFFLPRKSILFSEVEEVVQVSEVVLFIMNNGKEEQIYTDFLSTEDQGELIKNLKTIFDTKAVGF
ncbi:hypothetical protein [Fredinandcohnia onubensis]|uniref:hypothetical protein n=1 Tax=Fredinandcohnia onubensis TaxID=1571209 RepID=UPI000C0C011E|nr:hypothetical protein [Fredinandcohnia onubensis]